MPIAEQARLKIEGQPALMIAPAASLNAEIEKHEGRLADAYMACATASCLIANDKLAYIGAVAIAAPKHTAGIWSASSTNIINTLKNIDAFFQQAQAQITHAKQRGAAWTLQAA